MAYKIRLSIQNWLNIFYIFSIKLTYNIVCGGILVQLHHVSWNCKRRNKLVHTNFQWTVNHHIFLIHKIQLCWTMKKVIYFWVIQIRNYLIWFFFATQNQSFAIKDNWAAKICFCVYTKCEISSLHWIPWNINNSSISGMRYIFCEHAIVKRYEIWGSRSMLKRTIGFSKLIQDFLF